MRECVQMRDLRKLSHWKQQPVKPPKVAKVQRMREPIMGYRTKTEAVHAMRSSGMMPRHIAEALQMTKGQVKALIWHAQKNRPDRFAIATLEMPEQVLVQLRPFAAKRNMDGETLAVRLLARCIEDGLVDAVLDDQGGEL